MIYIEILIVLVILVHGWLGFRRGFLSQICDLISIVLSLVLALRYFENMAVILSNWGLDLNLTKPVGFLVLWILLQMVFYFITLLIFRFIPSEINTNIINRYLGIIPGLIKGMVIIAIILMIFFILPFSASFKNKLSQSSLAGFFIESSARIESRMDAVFGSLQSLNFFGTIAQSEEMTQLDFKVDRYTIDEKSEDMMLTLVNNDRADYGLLPLKLDPTIRQVARLHSIDMAQNGYFSHLSLTDKTPADRMTEGGVQYWIAGENIALAPNASLAEIGFMNSPKHRDNILDQKYTRVGIGIIDLGVYGKMVTQNFAD